MKVRLREIKVTDLDAQSMILLTQFVRMARKAGADLKMQYPDVVRRVFSYAAVTDDPDLIVLFMRLKNHIINYVVKSNLEKPSFNMYSNSAADRMAV